MNQNSANSEVKPYKEVEFETFLNLIGDENIENWTIMAEVLGVSRDTIGLWMKHPKAKAAISKAINKNLAEMEKAGKRDWKMYREKLKMLGVIEKQRTELTGKDGERLIPSPIYGGKSTENI